MISNTILHFLKELAGTNNKVWYQKNKDLYVQARAEPDNRWRYITEIGTSEGIITDLVDALSALRNQYRVLYLTENYPYRIERYLTRYNNEQAFWTQMWDLFYNDFRALYQHTSDLPAPEEIGIEP